MLSSAKSNPLRLIENPLNNPRTEDVLKASLYARDDTSTLEVWPEAQTRAACGWPGEVPWVRGAGDQTQPKSPDLLSLT